jgi:hypothetical protein
MCAECIICQEIHRKFSKCGTKWRKARTSVKLSSSHIILGLSCLCAHLGDQCVAAAIIQGHVMEIPTTRELELEVLVRQRDKHITDLQVCCCTSCCPYLTTLQAQVASLKKRVSISEAPQDSQSVTLPPGWVSYLLPRIREARERAVSSGSGAISTALVQRVKALQDENEELYNSLQSSETARLAERVYTLQRAVSKLEGALQGWDHI